MFQSIKLNTHITLGSFYVFHPYFESIEFFIQRIKSPINAIKPPVNTF